MVAAVVARGQDMLRRCQRGLVWHVVAHRDDRSVRNGDYLGAEAIPILVARAVPGENLAFLPPHPVDGKGLRFRDGKSIGGNARRAMAHDRVAAAVPVQPPRAAQGRLNNDLGLRADRQDGTVETELVQLVRQRIGPVAAFKTAVVVPRLPKTRSGKILRGTMRRIADSEEYAVPATIDDPAILDEIETALQSAGYAAPLA